MNKRTFVAIPVYVSRELADKIYLWREILNNDKIRWTHMNSMHLTISFIGETAIEHIPLIGDFLTEKLVSVYENELVVGAPGFFGKPESPSVLWVDVHVPDEIKALREKLDNFLRELGYKRDSRAYQPHLTIGRVKSLKQPDKLLSFIEKNKNALKYLLPLKEIIFYESKLSGKGATHLPLKIFKL